MTEVMAVKISTKGRYALRLMLDLALHGGDGRPVSLKDVSRRQQLSDKYLEQIVTPLSKAGLVRSMRGAGGGYLLTRGPADYTVGEILRPLEGDLAPVECATDAQFCERSGQCVTVELWQQEKGDKPCGFVLYEKTNGSCLLHEAVAAESGVFSAAAVAVGCEGGIAPDELNVLQQAGFIPVHFYTNILRTETATVYGLSALQTVLTERNVWQLKESIS